MSYEELQRRRKMTDEMANRIMGRQPKTVAEGFAALLTGAATGIDRWRTDKALRGYDDRRSELRNRLYASITGMPYDPAAFGPASDESSAGSTSAAWSSGGSSMPKVDSAGNIPPSLSTTFSGNQQEFVDALLPAAIEEGRRTGVDPRIIVAQAAQETGWGKSAPGNNFFGIKSHGQSGGNSMMTHEYVDGKRVNVRDSFRAYDSPADSVRGYGDFITQNPRYKPLREAKGLDAQLAALQASGYATDPNYSRSVGSIARGIQLPNEVASLDPSARMGTGIDAINAISPPSGQPLAGPAPYRDPMVSTPNADLSLSSGGQQAPNDINAYAASPWVPEDIKASVAGLQASQQPSPLGNEPMAFIPNAEPGMQLPPLPSREVGPAPLMSGMPPQGALVPPVQVAQNGQSMTGQGYFSPAPDSPAVRPLASRPQQSSFDPGWIQLLTDPGASAEDRAMAQFMVQRYMDSQDPSKQLDQRYKQAQIDALNSKAAKGEDETYYGNPVPFQRADGSFGYGQIGSRGGFKEIEIGQGNKFAPNTRTVDTGTELLTVGPGGEILSREPKNNRQAEADKAGGRVEGETSANRQAAAAGDYQAGLNALDLIGDIRNDPYKARGTGWTSYGNMIRGTGGYDFQNKVNQAKSGAFLTAIQQLRGMGALSNAEGDAATRALNRLDTAASEEEFDAALNAYETVVRQGIARAQGNLPQGADVPPVPPPAATGNNSDPLGLR